MAWHQEDEEFAQVQGAADGLQKQQHQSRDPGENQKGQAHDAGLIADLGFLRVFYPGVYQGALGLHGGGDGQNADPHVVVGYVAVAAGAQKPGEQGRCENGDAVKQAGA